MTNRSFQPNRFLALIDGLFGLGIAIASVLSQYPTRVAAGHLAQFLEIRVTIANAAFGALFVVLWVYSLNLLGLYRFDLHNIGRALGRIPGACAFMAAILSLYLFFAHTKGSVSRATMMFFVSSTSFEIGRLLIGSCLRNAVAARDPQRVLILGSGRRAGKAWREVRTHYHGIAKLIGFVDDRSLNDMAPDVASRYVGTVNDLSNIFLRNVVDVLLVALPVKSCYDIIQRAITISEQVGVRVVYLQDVYATGLRPSGLGDQELFSELIPLPEHYVSKRAAKRLLDIIGASVGLCIFSPLMLLIAMAVKLSSPGPALFIQERFGHRRRLFRIYKFRSMVQNASALMSQLEEQNEADGPIFKIRHDPRITWLGRFLRAFSLDELPQLWNVLVGDMSLVGPRPMSVRDVSLFNQATLMRRFSVKPGITGLWQVSGRSNLSFDQWMNFDFNYIDDWSLAMDFKILMRTVTVVLKRSGAV